MCCVRIQMSAVTLEGLSAREREKQGEKGMQTHLWLYLRDHQCSRKCSPQALKINLSWPERIRWRVTPGAALQSWNHFPSCEFEEALIHVNSLFSMFVFELYLYRQEIGYLELPMTEQHYMTLVFFVSVTLSVTRSSSVQWPVSQKFSWLCFLPSAEILYAICRWTTWHRSCAGLSKVRWYLLAWKSQDLHHAAYSVDTCSINAVTWSSATKVGRKWLYLLELLSFLILTLFLETTGESLRSKTMSRTGVMSAGGPGVSSPHGVSWQDDRTLRTGIHISPMQEAL